MLGLCVSGGTNMEKNIYSESVVKAAFILNLTTVVHSTLSVELLSF